MPRLPKGYKICPCCELVQHEYMFPLTSGARDYSKCIGCKRELCGKKSCKLGNLHDR